MIRNLVFDFGKVLVDYDFSLLATLFADKDEALRFIDVIADPAFVAKCDLEAVPFHELVNELKEQYPQWQDEFDFFEAHQIDFITGEVPGMCEVLQKLRKEGFRLFGLSNWSSKVYEVMAHYDILSLLEDRIISSEEGVVKPDRAIYELMLQKFGLCAEECVFTDDKPVNIVAAEQVGIHGIVFENAEQYERDLRILIHSISNE